MISIKQGETFEFCNKKYLMIIGNDDEPELISLDDVDGF